MKQLKYYKYIILTMVVQPFGTAVLAGVVVFKIFDGLFFFTITQHINMVINMTFNCCLTTLAETAALRSK